jgi:hypothetical protein
MYRRWFHLVTLAFVIPIPFLAMHLWLRRPEWFAPSGAITLFLVGVVQFKQLGMLENKHITNAERASRGESVQLLSEEYRRLEVRSFGLPYSERASGPTVTRSLVARFRNIKGGG